MRELIEAGAGCGKTYGLVTRYLSSLGVERTQDSPKRRTITTPSKILTLTFTNDAAEEMKSRIISALVDAQRSDLALDVEQNGKISTFHAYCYKIVKPHLRALGYDDDELLSSLEVYSKKIEHILHTLSNSEKSLEVQKIYDLRKIVSFCISNWRRSPREFQSEIENLYTKTKIQTQEWLQPNLDHFKKLSQTHPEVFENPDAWPYMTLEALTDQNWDLLFKINFSKGAKSLSKNFPSEKETASELREFVKNKNHHYLSDKIKSIEIQSYKHLFEFLEETQSTSPKILDFDALEFEAQKILQTHKESLPKFDLIIVDEFQDTNKRQVEIIEALMGPHTEIYYVGDPKQAIYSFRGGDVRVFEEQKQKLQTSQLEINRRSLPDTLALMNALTSEMFVAKNDPSPQRLLPCQEKTKVQDTRKPKLILNAFESKKDPLFWDTLAEDLRERKNVATKAILCQHWNKAAMAYDELTKRGISCELGTDIDLSKHHLSSLWISFLKTCDPQAEDHTKAIEYWNHLAKAWDLDLMDSTMTSQDPRSWLRAFVRSTHPHRWLEGLQWLAAVESWVQKHATQFRWFPTATKLASMFQKSLNLKLSLDDSGSVLNQTSDHSVVTITTIHKSKGLQYESVFLIDLFDGTYRGSQHGALDSDAEENLDNMTLRDDTGKLFKPLYFKYKKHLSDQNVLSEKKRLFYVAYTRAECDLFFYVPSKKEKSKSKWSHETNVWNWPENDSGYDWQSALWSVYHKNLTKLELRDHSSSETVDTQEQSDKNNVQPVELWTPPKPRPCTDSKLESYYKMGARTYIDKVLYPQDPAETAQKNFSDRAGSKPLALDLGSTLHKILETWNGESQTIDFHLLNVVDAQKKPLQEALLKLSAYEDLKNLWQDAQKRPHLVQREIGLFIHGPDHRLSGFADLIWYPSPDKAVILDWKTSTTSYAAFDPLKRAKTEAQVSLYAKSLSAMISQIEIWSLAIVFESQVNLSWLFKKTFMNAITPSH